MASDIYVQITASRIPAGRTRSVIVLVPETALRSFGGDGHLSPAAERAIAKKLADPFAEYAFTHRTIFDDYEVSYAFYENEPSEIHNKSPQWTQGGLQAWVI